MTHYKIMQSGHKWVATQYNPSSSHVGWSSNPLQALESLLKAIHEAFLMGETHVEDEPIDDLTQPWVGENFIAVQTELARLTQRVAELETFFDGLKNIQVSAPYTLTQQVVSGMDLTEGGTR